MEQQLHPAKDGSIRCPLKHPDDQAFLSELLCLVRSQIEAFVVSPDNNRGSRRSRGVAKDAKLGLVGIRCTHCAGGAGSRDGDEEQPLVVKGAVSYPRSIRLVYQAVRNWQRHHLLSCPAMPEEVKVQYVALRNVAKQRRSTKASPQYWEERCRRMGMIDTENGIRLRRGVFTDEGVIGEVQGIVDNETFSSGGCNGYESLAKKGTAASPKRSMETTRIDMASKVELCSDLRGDDAGNMQQNLAHHDSVSSELIQYNDTRHLARLSGKLSQEQAVAMTGAGQSVLLEETLSQCFSDSSSWKQGVNMRPDLECDSPVSTSSNERILERVILAQSIVKTVSEIRHILPRTSLSEKESKDDVSTTPQYQQQDMMYLGAELYELFSGENPFRTSSECEGRELVSNFANGTGEEKLEHQRKKEKQPEKGKHVPLSELGLPPVLSSLVSSLMNYSSNSSRNDYESFGEVEEDLHLISSEPERFLFHTSSYDLNVCSGALYGRDKEIFELCESYDQAVSSCSKKSNMVLISGYSGTGKSSLMEKAMDRFRERGAVCVSGKFDEMQQLQPLSAIVSAMDNYCELLAQDPDRINDLRMAVVSTIDGEGRVLANLIPCLRRIIPTTEGNEAATQVDGREALQRFLFLFRTLFRATCSCTHPVVLFLDDLQWADVVSLELMHVLVTDVEIEGLLFVGAHRDNEVSANHVLDDRLCAIRGSGRAHVKTIHIDNLDVDNVNSLISNSLHLTPRQTQSLAEAVVHKTGGNALFLVQFLGSLRDEGILRFSLKTRRWEWEIEKIRRKDLAENVAELMTAKLLRFSPDVHEALKIAAAFGAQCQEAIFHIISRDTKNALNILSSLDICVAEGLMMKVESAYKFSHDQIQLAAYLLIPEHEREAFHLKNGRLLLKWSSDSEIDSYLFVVVDQLHRGSGLISDCKERVTVSQLSLRAGKKASSMSAFLPASAYLSAGIGLLVAADWDVHRELCFDLHNSRAETEYVLGNFDEMQKHLDAVLTQASSLQEELRASFTAVQSLCAQSRSEEAINRVLQVLDRLGEKFPSVLEEATMKQELQVTQQILCSMGAEDILQLRQMENAQKKAAVKFLRAIIKVVYSEKKEFFPFLVCRIVCLSLLHGICRESASGFAAFGTFLCGPLGDPAAGYRVGKLALSILDKLDMDDTFVTIAVYGWVSNWTEPIQSSLPPLKHAVGSSMALGDTEGAMITAHVYITNALCSGQVLGPLQEEMEMYSEQMLEYKQHFAFIIFKPLRQFVLNLLGRSASPVRLVGEATNEDFLLGNKEEDHVLQFHYLRRYYQMWLEYLFGEYKQAWETSEENRDVTKQAVGKFAILCNYTFCRGLIALDLARKEGRREYTNTIDTSMKQMKVWTSSTPWNCQHKLELMKAEHAVLEGDFADATKAYNAAIDMSAKHHFIHEQALALERAGLFQLEIGDVGVASAFFVRARECYGKWGAASKAAHVNECYL